MIDNFVRQPPAGCPEPDLAGGNEPVGIADPTVETYNDINRAYQTFNMRLFGGRLKPSLITLRARGNVSGYFFPLRFAHMDGRRSHEIALNPEAFGYHTIEQCLSTLVHEMVHQAQFDSGTGGRRGYHNLDFARRMEEIGLPTSNTGAPGGKVTGERMSHFIAPDGMFLAVATELLDANFRARWAERFVPEWNGWFAEFEGPEAPDAVRAPPTRAATHGRLAEVVDGQFRKGGELSQIANNQGIYGIGEHRVGKDPSKVKFVCACCHQAAWGKGSLILVCGICGEPMSAT